MHNQAIIEELDKILRYLNNKAEEIEKEIKEKISEERYKTYCIGISQGYTECINYIARLYDNRRQF